MKKYIYTLILFSYCNLISAQLRADFETTFYIEDAVGNRDSVILGWEDDIEWHSNNPEYGEILDQTPFDSILEARALKYRAGQVYNALAKKMIYATNPLSYSERQDCYGETEIFSIAVNAIHDPITISWNRYDFASNFCTVKGFIIDSQVYAFLDGWEWFYTDSLACISEVSTFIDHFSDQRYEAAIRFPIDGQGEQWIRLLEIPFVHQNAFGPDILCTAVVSAVEELRHIQLDDIVYPNPTYDILHFREGKSYDYTVYSTNGVRLMQGKGRMIDMSSLISGLYLIQIRQEDKLVTHKVVKQ